ncbi:MAG: hypothetical protein AB7T59_19425 [Hyphomonadaceae bacterium]
MSDTRISGIVIILIAVAALTVAQIVLKSRLSVHGAIPFSPPELASYFGILLRDWRVWAGGLTLLVASLLWYGGVSRLPLSQAFGFAALTYPLVFFSAIVFLREPFSWVGLLGNALIVAGVLMLASVKGAG